MSKHTPGPWYPKGTGTHQGLVIAEGSGENVAVTYNGRADAQLIAAAPELLEACKIARAHLEQYEAYSEEMRAFGRGASISSEFRPSLLPLLDAAIRAAEED